MRLSSLPLSTLLAVLMLKARVVAAFAIPSSSGCAARRSSILGRISLPTRWECDGGGAANAPARVLAFVLASRLRAGASFPPASAPGPLRASTQEAAAAASVPSDRDREEEEEEERSSALRAEIARAAAASMDIAGPSTELATFGSLRYVDTSKLDSSVPKQHRVLFVLGGPGAGKGTQSERIVDSYKCVHLSVGELLRQERQRGDASRHAELIEDCLVHGKIVPVEISLELLRNAMDEACTQPAEDGRRYGSRIFLVDGFPRNFDNLSGWVRNMPDAASTMGVLCYDCPQDVLERRILSRAETSGRSDDNLESARKRFRTFREKTVPVVEALEEVERSSQKEGGAGRMHVEHIVADGTIEEVWDRTRSAMDNIARNDVLSANARLMDAIDANDFEAYAKLCDGAMLGDDDDEGEEAGTDRLQRIFCEYEVARVESPSDAPQDAIRSAPVSLKQTNEVTDAKIQVQDGTHAVVSYDRTMHISIEGTDQEMESTVKETRVWKHGEEGWVCVHFYRKPL